MFTKNSLFTCPLRTACSLRRRSWYARILLQFVLSKNQKKQEKQKKIFAKNDKALQNKMQQFTPIFQAESLPRRHIERSLWHHGRIRKLFWLAASTYWPSETRFQLDSMHSSLEKKLGHNNNQQGIALQWCWRKRATFRNQTWIDW